MRAINHALTGALIGLSVLAPWVAVPVALASHFVCDAIPHYGAKASDESTIASKSFAIGLFADAALCGLLVLLLILTRPEQWLSSAVCAFIATAPDLLWIPGYMRARSGQAFRASKQNVYTVFAKSIQWFERPIGAVVELAWFVAASVLLTAFLAA